MGYENIDLVSLAFPLLGQNATQPPKSLSNLHLLPPWNDLYDLGAFFVATFLAWSLARVLIANILLTNVAKWFGLRRSYQEKFGESMWFFLYYFSNFMFGICLLYDKPHLYDSRYFWYNYPDHHMSPAFQFYYISQLGFYVSALLFLFPSLIPWVPNARLKHKDRTIMLIHHFVTIALVAFSFGLNYVRIGSFVFLLHDFSDIFLESAKSLHYIDKDGIAHVGFVMFATSFFICRIVLFPYRTTWSIYSNGYSLVEDPIWAHFYISLFLLGVLQLMNISWFGLILRMIFKGVEQGKMDKDIRSDSDDDTVKED